MECIIIDHKSNIDSRKYIDKFGGNYGPDSIDAATPFESQAAAQEWLNIWDAEIEAGTRRGYMSAEWAEIVPFAQVNPGLRMITAYHVVGIGLTEFHREIVYIGENEEAAMTAHEEAQRKYKSGAVLTKFEFPLWATESMPDGHEQWMGKWHEGTVIDE